MGVELKIKKSDIVWAYLSYVLSTCVNIIILPIILRKFNAADIGIWYVFTGIQSFVLIMDFGFSPTFSRNATLCWLGAKELIKEGYTNTSDYGYPNLPLLKSLIDSSKKIYKIISIVAAVALFILGSIYIYYLNPERLLSWLLYAVAVTLSLYFNYLPAILRGIGGIKESNIANVFSRLVYVAIVLFGVLSGLGLVALSLALIASVVCLQYLSNRFFFRIVGKDFKNTESDNKYKPNDVFKVVWYNAKKLGIVSIATFLITKVSVLLCSSFLGLEVTASYGLSLQLYDLVGALALVLLNNSIPEITSAQVSLNEKRCILLFSRAMVLQWLISIVGVVFIVCCGEYALKLIGAKMTLLDKKQLLILGIVMFLGWNHSSFASLITTANKVPFVIPGIISGSCILLFSVMLLSLTNLGIWGIIIARGLVQLAFDNWYWPRYICKEKNITLAKIFSLGSNEWWRVIRNGIISRKQSK